MASSKAAVSAAIFLLMASVIEAPDLLAERTESSAMCEVEYGGRVERVELQSTTDVYTRVKVPVGNRFHFAAQLLDDRGLRLKTFVYEIRIGSPVLVHASRQELAADACRDGRDVPFGEHQVYAADLERELIFRCSVRCR